MRCRGNGSRPSPSGRPWPRCFPTTWSLHCDWRTPKSSRARRRTVLRPSKASSSSFPAAADPRLDLAEALAAKPCRISSACKRRPRPPAAASEAQGATLLVATARLREAGASIRSGQTRPGDAAARRGASASTRTPATRTASPECSTIWHAIYEGPDTKQTRALYDEGLGDFARDRQPGPGCALSEQHRDRGTQRRQSPGIPRDESGIPGDPPGNRRPHERRDFPEQHRQRAAGPGRSPGRVASITRSRPP